MSPEQTKSAKHVDARTDQHALGLILYELLTGTAAFEGDTALGILVDIRIKPAPHPRSLRPDVPVDLDGAIVRALAKDPDERYSDLAAFARALAPFGGPQAAGWAQAVEAAIAAPSQLRYGDGASSEAAAPTLPSAASPLRASPLSVSDTAATRPMIGSASRPETGGRRPMVAALAALAVLATLVTVALALRGTGDRGDDVTDAPAAPTAAAAATPPPESLAPPAPVPSESAPDASASAASSGTAEAGEDPRPTARPSAARPTAGPRATGGSDDPKKVFNKR
jgi:serine/threonine-protein kinase